MNLYNLIIQDKEQVSLNEVFLNKSNRDQLVQLIKEHNFLKELQEYGLPLIIKFCWKEVQGAGKR